MLFLAPSQTIFPSISFLCFLSFPLLSYDCTIAPPVELLSGAKIFIMRMKCVALAQSWRVRVASENGRAAGVGGLRGGLRFIFFFRTSNQRFIFPTCSMSQQHQLTVAAPLDTPVTRIQISHDFPECRF